MQPAEFRTEFLQARLEPRPILGPLGQFCEDCHLRRT